MTSAAPQPPVPADADAGWSRRKAALLAWSGGVVVVGDRLTKELARWRLADVQAYDAIELVPDVAYLYLHRNEVGMLGFLSGIPSGWRQAVFVAATVVFVAYLGRLLWQAGPEHEGDLRPLALVLAGFVGNGIDRVLYGGVVDFVVLHLPGLPAAANVADVAIFAGLAWWLVRRVRPSPASGAAA
ncbi:MAG: signal peptidase II [Alphaproteobacteria bacterium]|nr:signal peptidase II [Alphaproteobacteria bacterium]